MSSSAFITQLAGQFQAGCPGVYIQTHEEARLDRLLAQLVANLALTPLEWNQGQGFVNFTSKQPLGAEDAPRLDSALHSVLDMELAGRLLIIKDASQALDQAPLAVARLKQVLLRIERHSPGEAMVLLVGEHLQLPPALESRLGLLPLPLPGREELAALVNKLGHALPATQQAQAITNLSGLTEAQARQTLRMVTAALPEEALDIIRREKEKAISKSGVLEMVPVRETASDIGGLENLKDWLARRAIIFSRLAEAEAQGIKAPKGVLIAGMPGCGKSLTAKVAANLFRLPLLRLDIGGLLGKYVGESEHNMRRALSLAETMSPCILWIDELEKAFAGMNGQGGSEVSARLFGYFLTWMQEKTGAVFVIATANDITALPPELLRKGRFDEVFYVGFPSREERKAILEIHLKDIWKRLDEKTREDLAAACRDYTGADIENSINEARERAFSSVDALSASLIRKAIKDTVPLRQAIKEQVGRYEELFETLKLKPSSRTTGLSIAQMIRMAKDPNPLERLKIAEHDECTEELLAQLATDRDEKIRIAVFKNRACTADILARQLSLEDHDARYEQPLYELALLHPEAPRNLVIQHIRDGKPHDSIVSQIPTLVHPEHINTLFELFFEHGKKNIRRAILECKECPKHVVDLQLDQAMSDDNQDEKLLKLALIHRNASPDKIEELMESKSYIIEIVSESPFLTERQQAIILEKGSKLAKSKLALNPLINKTTTLAGKIFTAMSKNQEK